MEGGSFGILRETLQGGVTNESSRMTATLSRADAFDGINLANQKQNPEREPTHYTKALCPIYDQAKQPPGLARLDVIPKFRSGH